MSKKFQRTIENFKCEHCGYDVVGTGYTNHCPACLYSKHVDINPGDRAAQCGGMMNPVEYYLKAGEVVIVHQCEKCGHRRPNKVSPEDALEALLKPRDS
ncbi:MAG: RNHCP domain-containing protein [Candidatus Komeilibacteria bacterium]|nr:RNHCP domain-containing protein [Candidatus Komeilibacteria bacterium]